MYTCAASTAGAKQGAPKGESHTGKRRGVVWLRRLRPRRAVPYFMLPAAAAAGLRTPLDCTGVLAALRAFYPVITPLLPTTTPCSFDMKWRLGSRQPAHRSLLALLASLLQLSAAAAAGASGLQSFTGVRRCRTYSAVPLQVSPSSCQGALAS